MRDMLQFLDFLDPFDMRDMQISDSLDPCDPRDMCDMQIDYQKNKKIKCLACHVTCVTSSNLVFKNCRD